jgi:pentatricopeptide repeat protein
MPDIMAYNSLLNAYSKAGMPKQAQSLLELMVEQYLSSSHEKYPRPQTASFNTVLSAWAKTGNTEMAEELFQWMQQISSGLDTANPNVISYTNLLNCWAKSQANKDTLISRVESLIREMEESLEIQPNLVSYAALCKSYARFGIGSSALTLLRAMPYKNIQPNNIIYAQVIHALAENCVRKPWDKSIMDHVETLMKEMDQHQIQPTITTYSACLKAISVANIPNKVDRAKSVVGWMREAGMQPNDVIQRQVARILANNSRNSPKSIIK